MSELPKAGPGHNALKGWDWAYGQTPEFEYAVEKRFEWGNVTATIRSKHGVILSCDLMLSPSSASVSVNIQPALDELGQRLEGRRYGFIQDMDIFSGSEDTLREMADSEVGAVWRWLKVEMSA
ncbi:hypothetical protein ID866_3587 [Astraeus odoratus]|nr:hypothetical protein ID866_3587 [Astraeus odoratus]